MNRLDPGVLSWPRDLDQLFGRLLEPESHNNWLCVDVREEGSDLVFEAEVPGLTKNDISITVEGGVLYIGAEYKSSVDEEKANYHVRERRFGKVNRSFHLPSTADTDKISAVVKEGILTLRVPTKEEAKPRKVEIK